ARVAHRGAGGEGGPGGRRYLLCEPAAGGADRRLGIRAERADLVARGAGGQRCRVRAQVWPQTTPASALGGLPTGTGPLRILAGPLVETARPDPLSPRWDRRMAARPARPLVRLGFGRIVLRPDPKPHAGQR